MHMFDHISVEDRGLNRGHQPTQSDNGHVTAFAGGAISRRGSRVACVARSDLRHDAAARFEHGTIAWTGQSGSRSLQ